MQEEYSRNQQSGSVNIENVIVKERQKARTFQRHEAETRAEKLIELHRLFASILFA